MSLTRISIRQLEVFVMVAEMRGFAAAGERMGLSSSAVSQLIAELEANLGFRVFDRSTRRVELSGAGRDFLSSAQSVLRHVQRAESTAADIRNRASGVVRIGAPQVLAGAVLPRAIRIGRHVEQVSHLMRVLRAYAAQAQTHADTAGQQLPFTACKGARRVLARQQGKQRLTMLGELRRYTGQHHLGVRKTHVGSVPVWAEVGRRLDCLVRIDARVGWQTGMDVMHAENRVPWRAS